MRSTTAILGAIASAIVLSVSGNLFALGAVSLMCRIMESALGYLCPGVVQ